jgi:hypothetical protein
MVNRNNLPVGINNLFINRLEHISDFGIGVAIILMIGIFIFLIKLFFFFTPNSFLFFQPFFELRAHRKRIFSSSLLNLGLLLLLSK